MWTQRGNRPSFFSLNPEQVEVMWEMIDNLEDDRERLAAAVREVEANPRVALKAVWKRIHAQYPGAPAQFRYAVRQAIARGHSWELTLSDYLTLTAQPCEVCGGDVGNGCGLDRLDNRGGYTPDNVRPCCGACNVARGHRRLGQPPGAAKPVRNFGRPGTKGLVTRYGDPRFARIPTRSGGSRG